MVDHGRDGPAIQQHQIEQELGYARTSAELFYRLESLIAQGFLSKRRTSSDGQFSYRLSDEFRAQLQGEDR